MINSLCTFYAIQYQGLQLTIYSNVGGLLIFVNFVIMFFWTGRGGREIRGREGSSALGREEKVLGLQKNSPYAKLRSTLACLLC